MTTDTAGRESYRPAACLGTGRRRRVLAVALIVAAGLYPVL